MLRWVFLALVAVNLGYFLWSGDGAQATGNEREPQRLGQQVRPEMLQIRKADALLPSTPIPSSTPAAVAPTTDGSATR